MNYAYGCRTFVDIMIRGVANMELIGQFVHQVGGGIRGKGGESV